VPAALALLALQACSPGEPAPPSPGADGAAAPVVNASAPAPPAGAFPVPANASAPPPAAGLAAAAQAAPPAAGPGGAAYGDRLLDASIAEATNLIPALASDTSSTAITGQIYRGLVKYDRDLNLVPDLAESWEVSDDQLTVTFRLKGGVQWEDGTPFTAEDCLFTWRLMSDPLTPTPYGEDFRQIARASAPDPLTFVVTYHRTLASAVTIWGFSIMPRHLLDGADLDGSPLARRPVGNGPFRLLSWEPGQRVTLAASDTFSGGRPYLDALVTTIIPDMATQLMELRTGTLDMMSLTPDQWEQAREDPELSSRFSFYKYPAFSYAYLGFNLNDRRLADVRVRRAINHAIDKEELVEGVLLGLGTVANGPFKPDMWANNADVKPFPFDPEKARALLAEAGWTDTDGDGYVDREGRRFTLTVLTNQGNKVREQCALIIQQRLKAVGVEVKIRILEWAALTKENLDKHDFEAVIMGWTIPLDPDLFDVFNSTKTNPGELNFISYRNPEVDRLIDEARFTLDRAARKAALDRIQEIFYEDVPYVFLFVPDSLVALSNRFVGPEVAPIGLGYDIEKWWVPQDRQVWVN
jgi:peptide/nickel transport system substrate-binding protein